MDTHPSDYLFLWSIADEYMAEKESRVIGNQGLTITLSFLAKNFVKILTTYPHHNLRDPGYFIRVSIISFKQFFLKYVCNDVYGFLSCKADSFPNQQWYETTLDLTESRLFSPPIIKTTKTTISRIISDKNVKKNLPTQFNKQNKFQQYIH